MGKRKLALMAMAVAAIWLVASGGVLRYVLRPGNWSDYFLSTFERIAPFDIAVGMVGLILLSWAWLIGQARISIDRSVLLRGIAIGSGIMALVGTVVNVATYEQFLFPEFPAIVALVALLHAVIGFTAALLLLCRRESRRSTPLPLFMNTTALAAIVGLFFLPLFM